MGKRHGIGAVNGLTVAGVGCLAAVLAGCIRLTDVTGESENPVIQGNPYCTQGAEFVVAYPLRISPHKARTGGYSLYEVSLRAEPESVDYGPNQEMTAQGYLRVGETVRVERVIWVEHFDVGDHVEIRATVLNGRYKGMAVDLKNVQNEKLLKKAGGAGGGTPGE